MTQQQQRPKDLTDLSVIDERRAAALRACGIETPEHIAAATVEQLQQVEHINRAMAGRIQREVDHINPDPNLTISVSADGGSSDISTGRLWLARAVGLFVFIGGLSSIPTQSAAATTGSLVGVAAVAVGATVLAKKLL